MGPEPKEHRYHSHSPPVSKDANHAVRFLLNSLNATIYASGDDYCGAVEEFFPQVQALGHLIGARSLAEVSAFMRDRRHW